jgi:hypothetical protein
MNTEGKNSIQYQYLPEETMQIKEYDLGYYENSRTKRLLQLSTEFERIRLDFSK